MDQVRFELTSSRSQGEVTLPYTTSNLAPPVAQAFRPEALPYGGKIPNREEQLNRPQDPWPRFV